WERFKWRTVDYDILGNAVGTDAANYSNVLSQRLWGVQCGCGNEWFLGSTPIGAFSLSLDLQAALFINLANERAKYELGDFSIAASRHREDTTIVPELQAKVFLWYYPFEGVQLRVGYNVQAFFNTIASPQPVDFNYGAIAPAFEKGHTRTIDGLEMGI